MTINQLFDLVAPIAIWHRTDVLFINRARTAWTYLRRLPDDEWNQYNLTPFPQNCCVDDLNDWSWNTYNQLFAMIVQEYHPDWSLDYDTYGARCVVNENGMTVFSGDDCGSYPWYETAQLLIERITDPQLM